MMTHLARPTHLILQNKPCYACRLGLHINATLQLIILVSFTNEGANCVALLKELRRT